jgi:hypothetical protein
MTDIVGRLRTGFDWDYSEQNIGALIQYGDLTNEAADEIERLREKHKACVDITLRQGSEIERLREDNSVWLKAWNAKEKALAESQAREEKLREALDLLWANANHEEWSAMARDHFECLIEDIND